METDVKTKMPDLQDVLLLWVMASFLHILALYTLPAHQQPWLYILGNADRASVGDVGREELRKDEKL